ncbi:unnamed protein product [Echinostoma caproni]|uniref:Uncharacterized protein n=1 Tax=Echinostoma caproni TaxID=27848 RepID=A0A3P8C4U1_9TREM|nr:unnamed protein product [Echinostoma caproni]
MSSYPPGSSVVVVEPLADYRLTFERRLSELNASRDDPKCSINLEAWYSIPAEELAVLNKSSGGGDSAADGSIGQFDAAVSTFTLCCVRDMDQVLSGLTQLVKPVSFLLDLMIICVSQALYCLLAFDFTQISVWKVNVSLFL